MSNLKNQLLTIIEIRKEQGAVCHLTMDWPAVRAKVEKRSRFILTSREKRIIELLAENNNYREVGVFLNVTRERIRQIEARIWHKLIGKIYYIQGNRVSIWKSQDGLEGFMQIPHKDTLTRKTFYNYHSARGETTKEILDKLKVDLEE